MVAPIDWNDPCARFQALQTAYYQALAGDTRSVHFDTGGGHSQSVEFTPADKDGLKAEMTRAHAECKAKSGLALPGRFAIQVGARSRLGYALANQRNLANGGGWDYGS